MKFIDEATIDVTAGDLEEDLSSPGAAEPDEPALAE